MAQKSLLITGCSSGIGYDAAHHMRAKGWRVFASCRKEADCDRLRAEGFESPRIDYEDEASIALGLEEVLDATNGTLDGLFNNGAYAIPGLIEDLPRDALRAIFEANLFGWLDLTARAIPAMRAKGSGRIVMNSSVLGFISTPWRGAYTGTKYALEGMTDALRMELRGTGIHVSLIEPGPITARFRQNAASQFKKWIRPENSVRAADYARMYQRFESGLGQKDSFELPAAAVSRKLEHALLSRRPRPRYYVTLPTYFASLMRRTMSTRARDLVLHRS